MSRYQKILPAVIPVLALLLSACGGDVAPGQAEKARMRARNDARAIINHQWQDSLARAEAIRALKDSAATDFSRMGEPGLSAPYDSILDLTIRVTSGSKKAKMTSND